MPIKAEHKTVHWLLNTWIVPIRTGLDGCMAVVYVLSNFTTVVCSRYAVYAYRHSLRSDKMYFAKYLIFKYIAKVSCI